MSRSVGSEMKCEREWHMSVETWENQEHLIESVQFLS